MRLRSSLGTTCQGKAERLSSDQAVEIASKALQDACKLLQYVSPESGANLADDLVEWWSTKGRSLILADAAAIAPDDLDAMIAVEDLWGVCDFMRSYDILWYLMEPYLACAL